MTNEFEPMSIIFNSNNKEYIKFTADGKFFVNGEQVVGIENIGQAFMTFLITTKSVQTYKSIAQNLDDLENDVGHNSYIDNIRKLLMITEYENYPYVYGE